MVGLGEAWLMLILVLGGTGFVLGSLVVFTISIPLTLRLAAGASMIAALVIVIGLHVVGLIGPRFSSLGVFLAPLLVAIGLRHLWSRTRRKERMERD